MKHLPVIITVMVVMFTTPASAHAGPVPPIGATLCSEAGVCMTTLATDNPQGSTQYVSYEAVQHPSGFVAWGSEGCSSVSTVPFPGACVTVPCVFTTWTFTRHHVYRSSDWHLRGAARRCFPFRADIAEISVPGPDFVESRPQFDTPDCNPTGDNERWFTSPPDAAGVTHIGMKPSVYAPDDFAAMCGGRESTPPPALVVADPPAKAATCAPIAVGKRKAAVTSLGLACASARNVLARFIRSGVEPRGWVCSRLSAGKLRSASCGTPGRAAKRIVGRWRL